MIKLQNISKTFCIGEEKVYALDNVNLKIEKGEFVSIIGPSGSREVNINEYFRIFRYTEYRYLYIR